MRRFITTTLHEILLIYQIKAEYMGGECSTPTHGRDYKHIHFLVGNPERNMATYKT
jgi:hypothetical protein